MAQLILLIHVFAALSIIGLVLIQQGKGAVTGASFGSGASQTVFGSRGSGSFLFRLTLGLMAVFFATSILMNYLTSSHYKESLNIPIIPVKSAPANKNLPATLPLQSTPVPTIPERKSS